MSGMWKRSTAGYSGTGNRKGRTQATPDLNHRATPRLYFLFFMFTTWFRTVWRLDMPARVWHRKVMHERTAWLARGAGSKRDRRHRRA